MFLRDVSLLLALCRRLPIASKETLQISSNTSYKRFSSASCWKCGLDKGAEKFFCSKCNTVLEPDQKLSFFDVLGVTRKFDIQPTELIQKFRRLQNQLHPDKFSGKSQEELDLSQQHSSILNEAFATLVKPLGRGLYLLRLDGKSVVDDTMESDKSLLMEIMELNERIDELKSKDDAEDLSRELAGVVSQLVRDIDAAFSKTDLERAKSLLIKFKYFNRLEDRIKEIKNTYVE